MRKLKVIILVIAVVLLAAGCGGFKKTEETDTVPKVRIGISLPDRTELFWNQDGANMQYQLEADGYEVILAYAASGKKTQAAQIENMVDLGCKVIIVAPVDEVSLKEVLLKAREAGTAVIAYRDQMGDESLYAGSVLFDYYGAGSLQAEYLLNVLDASQGDIVKSVELMSTTAGDLNAKAMYEGALSILKAAIDSQKVQIVSGKTAYSQIIREEKTEKSARDYLISLMKESYEDDQAPAGILCFDDVTALGAASAAEAYRMKPYPVIGGQGALLEALNSIRNEKMSFTVFMDSRTLAEEAVSLTKELLTGEIDEDADSEEDSLHRRVEPVIVTAGNYEQVLIDTGYYSESQLD